MFRSRFCPRARELLGAGPGAEAIGIAAWVNPSKMKKESELGCQRGLSSWLEQGVPYAIAAQALNGPSLGFKYAAGGGRLLWARDPVSRYGFGEQTREQALEQRLGIAPLARLLRLDFPGSPTE